jgi:PAS domain S-box-containing protein
MEKQRGIWRGFGGLVLGSLVLLGLYLTHLHSFLLFHALAELFSIVVACAIFLLAWNSQRFLDNTYLLFIGVAYLFIGATDLVHTLSYKGMGVFQGFDANLPTQLWIAGRYVQSLSFLAAFFFLNRRPDTRLVFSGYTLAVSLLFLSIFYWNIFPTCFVEGTGLTLFKKISEYVISLFLLASILLLLKHQKHFDRTVLQWLILSLLATIGSELFFTFYVHVYGLSNLVGHFLKILSFYFVYKAIIETGLTKPYTLLFRSLTEERDKAQKYLDIAGVILVVVHPDQTVTLINKKGREVLGYEEKEIIGKNWFDTFLPEWDRERVKENFIKLISGEIETIEYFESLVLTKSGEERIVAWHNAVLRNERNQIIGMLSSGEDITKNKEIEKTLAHLASFPELNPNPIVEVDFDGGLHYLNPAAHQLLSGIPNEDVHREWLGDLNLVIRNLQDQKKASYAREIAIHENWHHQSFHMTPALDRIRIYSLDITDRKRAEEALRKSRDILEIRIQERTAEVSKAYEKLRNQSKILEAFFSSTITPLVFLDKNFNFVRVNEAYAKACQRDVSEFPGHNHFEFYPSDAKPIFEEVVKTKTPHQAIARPFIFPDHPEWETTYWNWTLTPLLDGTGEVEFLVFALQDVTDRERAMQKAREQAALLELAHDAIIVRDIEDRILFWNHGAEEMYGWKASEALEKVARDILQTGFPIQLDEIKIDVIRRGKWEGELVHTRRDGKKIIVESRWALQRGKEDRPAVILQINRDITERKRAEEALRAAHQYNRSLIEASLDPLVTISPQGKVTDVNTATEQVTGFPRKELIGTDFSNYFTEPDKAREGYQQVFSKGSVRDYPLAIRQSSGRVTDVLYNATVYRNGAGEVQGVFAAARDITELKRTQDALRAASLYTRSLIEASLDPLVTISADGKIMDVNSATELTTGVPRDELIGTDFSNYFTEPDKAKEGYRQVFLEGAVRDYPLAIKDRSGRLTEVLYHATVYRNEAGEIQGVFAAARDVTERNEIGRRAEATNALLNLFPKLSHFKEYLDAAVNLLSVWSGCRCVGIRALDPKGYIPYESYVGFSREFWELETFLSIQRDQCACVRVISGELESQEACVVTPGGSFCCGNTLKFLEALSEGERSRYRGTCMKYGFLSVAIVPIRYKEKIVGAVHLADEGEGRVSFKSVEFIESMAPLIGEAVNRFKLEAELRKSENRLRLLSSRLLTVQEQERKRVAHELHDGIGQMLTAVKFKVEDTLQQMAKSRSRPKQALETIVPVIQQTVEEVRRIQMDLRPSLLDDIGILATIGWFTREFQKVYTSLRIEKGIDILEEQVPDSLKVVIFRVIQEALNNIAKHSRADLAFLSLKKSDGKLELAIGDNGQGFDLDGVRYKESPEKGFGLSSMRERTELSGGTFSIVSKIGAGTTIKATWTL